MLKTASEVFSDLHMDEKAMGRNLSLYGPFAATERVLMAAVKAGADRQQMHELIRSHALRAWGDIQDGEANPLEDLLSKDENLAKYLGREQLQELMKYESHLGDAPERARQLTLQIQDEIKYKAGT
jgi:adenylosuccinate lyase